jgi:Fe-S-cluster containining protein
MAEGDFLDGDGNWKCINCGACCKMIKFVYPNLDRGDGACVHLNEENKCDIYETRPRLCRIPEWYPGKLRARDCDKVRGIVEGETE